MWPYWIFFLFPAFLAINQGPVRLPLPKKWPIIWWLAYFALVMIIGLRFEVGGDWYNYLRHLENPFQEPLFEAMLSSDPAYKLLSWLAVQTGSGIILVNFVAALIFSWGLIVFCRTQPRPWLALSVAVPYLVIVVAMGYTRQGISIGLVMLAFVALSEKKMTRYFAFMAIALLFHKSAIVMFPLVALASPGKRWIKVILAAIFGILLYWVLVRDSQDALINSYIGAGYNSSGALVRLAMNAVPAALFLLFRKRFQLQKHDNSFWTVMALTAFLLIAAFPISPSSTALDRLALYWIPLQLFVFTRLPDVFGKHGSSNTVWVFLILLFYAAVLAVWLLFATNAYGWIPYKFFPWEWLWDLPLKARPV